MKGVQKFRLSDGREPFSDWFFSLDRKAQQKVDAYITRVRMGGAVNRVKRLSGHHRREIFEIAIDAGPGYRVYFAEIGSDAILLLAGGNKGTQVRDLERVSQYWRAYNVPE